jgi:glycosyltransferase involved in cell wall biosynthesis
LELDSVAETKDPALISEFDLTCLMPCLNEAETIELCIRQAQDSISRLGISGEVLVADNGSTDGSQDIARELGARVVNVEQKGYGAALQHGIASANGKYIIMGDADGSYTWDKLDNIYAELLAGSDLVMGNRFAGTIYPNAMPRLNKYVGNPVLSYIGRLFFNITIRDFHCGLRGFHRWKMLKLGISSSGMEFASEMVIKSSLSNLVISEVPTDLRPDGRSRAPHLRPIPDGWRHLRLMLSYSPKWAMRIPGIFLLLSGALLSILALVPFTIWDKVNFGIHTALIGSALMISGVQAIFSSFIGELAISIAIQVKVSSIVARMQQGEILDKILFLGFVLTGLGFIGFLISFSMWNKSGFGELQPDQFMKLLLPAVTLVVIGIQVMFSALLFETLRATKS